MADTDIKEYNQERLEYYQRQLEAASKIFNKTSKQIKKIEVMINYYSKQLQ